MAMTDPVDWVRRAWSASLSFCRPSFQLDEKGGCTATGRQLWPCPSPQEPVCSLDSSGGGRLRRR